MGKFDGVVLVSDFDGTLIDGGLRVSDENIQAIRSFVAQGGRFVGATGRTEVNVRLFTNNLPISLPWILYNGAAIYDLENSAFVYRSNLNRPLAAAFAAKLIARGFTANIQVYAGGPYAQINHLASPDAEAVLEGQKFEEKPLHEIKGEWLKLLFCSDFPEQLDRVEALLEDDPLRKEVHKTRSGQRYFELTAPGVTKGSALARLRGLLDPAPRCVVAMGDYRNDLEMLREADIGAAPANALPEVKAAASLLTVDHTRSAVADLVRQLERRF